jgi:hypothetical protein
MEEITVGKIRRSLRRFEDFAGDLARSDMNTFDDRLNLLMDYCKTDQVFSVIHAQLMSVPNVDFDIWHQQVCSTIKSMVGSGDLKFPTNLEERMALMYQLLNKINEKEVDFFNFTSNFFATSDNRIDSDIYAFNQAIVEPLARELSYRIEDMEEELPEDNKEYYPLANIQIIQNAKNVIQQSAAGNNIQQNAKIQDDDKLKQLFTNLRQELTNVIKEENKLKEALQIVQTSEELTTKGHSSFSALKVLLGSFDILGNIGSITSAILEIISRMK